MVIRIEANRRQRRGFQIHLMNGPLDMLFDKQPLDFNLVVICAGELLKQINREQGTGYKLWEVLQVTESALEANAKEDFSAARYLHDLKSGKFELSSSSGPDMSKAMIDGREETVLTGRETVLVLFFAWKNDKNQRARDGLRRYCEYICAHGRRGGATKALKELDRLP